MRFNKTAFAGYMTLILLSSCESDMDKFHDLVIQSAQTDHRIDEKEFDSLLSFVRNSDDSYINKFMTGNQPDCEKIKTHITNFLKAKQFDLTDKDTWNPCHTTPDPLAVNIFVDNSISMEGYFLNNASFKSTVSDLCTELRNLPGFTQLNLNFINSVPISIAQNAERIGIQEFCQKMDTAWLKTNEGKKGDRTNTDIATMLQNELEFPENTLNILISDCVYSPGKHKGSADEYKEQQYANIRNNFSDARRKHPNLSVLLVQCHSLFQGKYYDLNDHPHSFKNNRPYYIWFIGNYPQIHTILTKRLLSQIKDGYSNKIVFQSLHGPFRTPYKILRNHKIGEFQTNNGAGGPMTDATAETDGPQQGHFAFEMAVNLRQSLQDDDYFLDSSLFHANGPYSLSIRRIPDSPDMTTAGCSHIIRLETTHLQSQPLQIFIEGKFPGWIQTSSSDDDSSIETDSSQASKTLGLEWLVKGVYLAFYPIPDSARISTVSININR